MFAHPDANLPAPAPSPASRRDRSSRYYERLDQTLRSGMISIVQDTVDRIVEHLLFLEENSRGRPWAERSHLTLRFRVQGPLGGTYADEWSEARVVTRGTTKVRRNAHISTRVRKKKNFGRVLRLCRDWELGPSRDLLHFLHSARSEYAALAAMRRTNLEAAALYGEAYTPIPIADPKLGNIVAAARESRGLAPRGAHLEDARQRPRQRHDPPSPTRSQSQSFEGGSQATDPNTVAYEPLTSYPG